VNCIVAKTSASRLRRWSLAPALLPAAAHWVSAAAATPFAAPAMQSIPGPAAGTLRVSIAMVLVLAALMAAAWMARRFRGAGGAATGSLEVLAQVSLGARERAVLLRVGDRQLLIGVAPGNVRTLHVMDGSASLAPAMATDAADSAARPTFKSLLLKSLGK
jgi:flagellar protein FliO/FliZ